MTKKIKLYEYNGNKYTCSEYARLISCKTGQRVDLLKNRIRKGWSIGKLMLPDTVKRPVCQYTVDGEFVKKYDSIIDAVRLIKKIGQSAIRNSARMMKTKSGEDCTAGGFVWRYADGDSEPPKKINVVHFIPYNYDENRKYLKDRYDTIIEWCYKPYGKYYNNEKIKLWDGWKNDFELFYNDLLPLLKEAKLKYKTYKRRMKRGKKFENASDDLKTTHIWFSRIDKTEGYLPSNICFTTPDWTMRYRPESHRIVIDGEVKFIPEIYDSLPNQLKNEISEASIRTNVVVNNPLLYKPDVKHYLYNGKSYTRAEISSMLGVPELRLTHYLRKFGDNAVQKALEFKDHPTIVYKNKSWRVYELVDHIKHRSNLSEQTITSRVRLLKNKKTVFTKKDVDKILKSPKTETVYVKYKGENRRLIDLCKEKNFEYTVAWKRYKRGKINDELFEPLSESNTIEYNGIKYTVKDIAEKLGITTGAVIYRINKGWSNDRIFTR